MPLDPTLPAPDFSRSVTEPTVTPSLGVAGTLAPPPEPSAAPVAVHPNAQQLAEIDAQLAEQGQPPAPRHPLWDFTPEQLVDLQRNTDGKYNFVQQFSEDREAQQNPEIQKKVEDALALHLEKGISASDVGHAITGVPSNVGTLLWDLAKSTVGRVATGVRGVYEGVAQDPTQMTPEKQTGQQESLEQLAGTETALSGMATQASKFGRGLLHFAGEKVGLAKPYTELSQDEKSALLGDALAQIQAQKTIAAGHGPIVSKLLESMDVDPSVVDKLKIRPEELATHASGDPVAFAAMAKLFSGAGELTKTATPQLIKDAVSATSDWAAKNAVKATGKAITGVGKTAEGAAKVTKVIAPAGGAVLGGAGLLGEHPGIGAFVGYKAGKELVENLEKHEPQLKALTDLGRQVSGAKPLVSNLAQAIKSGAEVAPSAAADLAKGLAFDVALGAGTGETPEDIQGLGFGTILGAAGAGKRFGTHVISGQIVGPREYGSVVAVPGSGNYPALEKLHQQAMQSTAPGVRNRMNAIRGFARSATPNAEHFLTSGSNPEEVKAAITAAGGNADLYDPSNRGQSLTLPNGKNVVLTSDIAAAPHEAGHPLEKVIGEDGMSRWDDWAQQHYGPIWNDFGKRYAGALGWTPAAGSIQDFLADKSGFGRNDALEKLVGEGKSSADAHQYLADVEKQGGSWKDILTPDEQQAAGNRYISRELFAEHFDTLFKRSGGKPGIDPTGLQKVAIGIGNLVSGLGGNPIPGTTSEGLQAPLSFEGLQRVQAATKAASPTVSPAKVSGKVSRETPTFLGRGVIPSTPAQQQQAVEEAKSAVAAQTTQENKDNLSTAADAIAKGSGILADTATEQGKKFFPYRIVPTKEGGHTILGWDPDIFNQNAHDLARYVADHPELQAAFPFQIDPKQRSLTADEWDRFNKARDTYVANQLKGYTGSGEPLVVPKETQERAGVFAPPVTGAPEPLPQPVADLMNHLFGGTGELSAVQKGERATGKLPRNIQAQEISEATMPGRVSPLIQPRVFAGKAAEEKGLAGVPIKEVNPLRKQMQLASPGLPKPKGVLQQLDVDKIKKITPAPELPNFRANTLTTTAGFMPKETQAFIDQIDTSKPAEWNEIVKGFNGKYGGGQTGLSFNVGSKVSTPMELTALRESYGRSSELVKAAMASKDYDLASHFASKAQAAREAYEAATGETFDGKQGASADFIRSHFDPNYKAPMEGAVQTQEQPKTFIVRHGSTELNNADPDKDRIRGHKDIPLSEKGRREADETANQLADSGIKTIYTSDLSRASDTANAIADKTGAPVIPDERLRPWNFGPTIEGKPTSQMLPKIADLVDNPDIRPEGGETFNEFKDRFLSAYHDIQDRHPNENTAMVTHYRGTRLLDAWRAAGVDNDNIDKAVFDEYSPATKPGNVQAIDKQGNTVQAMHGLEGIKKMNDEEVARRQRRAETETTRLSSFAGDANQGIVLHSAKQRSTQFLDPEQSKDFLKENAKAKTPETKNALIESYWAVESQSMPALTHYSKVEGLKELDPEMHGTGLAGAERARARDYKEIYLPRTYFGTKDYLKEPGLGDVRYRAEVRAGKLYDFENDPKNLYPSSSELEEAGYAPMDQRAATTLYENRIHKAGYEGYVSKSQNAVAKFTATPVRQLRSENVQYMPDTDPRAIRAASVRDPETGEQWDAPSHFQALQKATQSGRRVFDLSTLQQGFTTNAGEYLDREQAYQRALELNQIKNLSKRAEELRKSMPGELASEVTQYQPAERAGTVNRKELAEARKEWTDKGTESRFFKNWFGQSKVVDSEGKPLEVYHGTTHSFKAFDTSKFGNPENDLGVGHYFTDELGDAAMNYGDIGGPDLTNRIEQRTDQLESEGLDRDNAKLKARRELMGKTPQTIAAYLKLENPVVLDKKGGTQFDYETDESGNESGTAVDLYHSLNRIGKEMGIDGQKVWNKITENGPEDITAEKVLQAAKEEVFEESNDPQGRIMSSEFARRVFEDLGFDGAILKNAAERYPRMGIAPRTNHYVAFKAEQVKSSDANRGTFSPTDPRYQYLPPKVEDFKDEKSLLGALKSPNWAILTGTQEKHGGANEEVNKLANENLEKALIADGYNPQTVTGAYKGVDQGKSFLVTGMSPEQASEWGNKYGQESVLTPHGFLYNDGTINPVDHSKTTIGEAAKKEDGWSQVEGGPPFSMGVNFSNKEPFVSPLNPEITGPVSVAVPAEKAVRSRVRTPEEVSKLSLDYVKENPDMKDFAEKSIEKFKTIPGFENIDARNTPKALNEISKRLQSNIEFLYNKATPENRAKWRQWYDIAKDMTERWAPEYEMNPHAIAAINARLSPQMDWFTNVTLTRRVLDTMKADPTFDESDRLYLKEKFSHVVSEKDRAHLMKELDGIKNGQRLHELNDWQAGMLLRSSNELSSAMKTHDHNLEEVPGAKATGWSKPFEDLRSVVSIYRNPSFENVNKELGGNHKVRSFYNNHVAPESPDWTTIDTHAVAAATLIPFGGSDQPVKDNFGSPKHKASGYRGTYFLYQDAYEQAAKKLGILPRELQSIVWEQMRGLVSREGKKELQRAEFGPIKEVHKLMDKKKISQSEGRERIYKILQEASKPAPETPELFVPRRP